jgi:hypothetical protein
MHAVSSIAFWKVGSGSRFEPSPVVSLYCSVLSVPSKGKSCFTTLHDDLCFNLLFMIFAFYLSLFYFFFFSLWREGSQEQLYFLGVLLVASSLISLRTLNLMS